MEFKSVEDALELLQWLDDRRSYYRACKKEQPADTRVDDLHNESAAFNYLRAHGYNIPIFW